MKEWSKRAHSKRTRNEGVMPPSEHEAKKIKASTERDHDSNKRKEHRKGEMNGQWQSAKPTTEVRKEKQV